MSANSFAEEKQLSNQDMVDIEQIYKSEAIPAPATKPVEKKVEPQTDEERKEFEAIKKNSDYQESKLKSVAELNNLSPFSDISMIQRKYLPKTERFQVYTALGLSTNSPWFFNVGGKVNVSYNFSEKFGVEASALFLTSFEKDAAKEIRDNNSLQPERFILSKSNLGLDFVWSPIYGKISTLDQAIVPYEMYFSLGGGITGTNSAEKNVSTAHLAAGQIFAISKSFAFRWDYSLYTYQATPEQDSIISTPPVKNTYNDLIFTAGVSFFFPEVSYR